MSYPNDILAAFLSALLPATVLLVVAAKCGLLRKLRRLARWQRLAVLAALAVVVGYGGDKPPPSTPAQILQLLTVLKDGTLKDVRGTVVSGTTSAALDAFAAESGQIAAALSNVVEDARADCVDLTNQLAQADYSAAYISLDMPRGTPVFTNHNIMVSFEKVAQTASNLSAWVWFSSPPATNVNVRVQYSIAEGIWSALECSTNYWPATESVGGVECVKYEYCIPQDLSGIPLRPQYEVEFGGFAAGEYLSVPETGVTVTEGETERLPYTGWDTYGTGDDALQVRHVGGIAVQATQFGTNYFGG